MSFHIDQKFSKQHTLGCGSSIRRLLFADPKTGNGRKFFHKRSCKKRTHSSKGSYKKTRTSRKERNKKKRTHPQEKHGRNSEGTLPTSRADTVMFSCTFRGNKKNPTERIRKVYAPQEPGKNKQESRKNSGENPSEKTGVSRRFV